jgi:hypothetical protein
VIVHCGCVALVSGEPLSPGTACAPWSAVLASVGCAADASNCVLSARVYQAAADALHQAVAEPTLLDSQVVLLNTLAHARIPAAHVTAAIDTNTGTVTLSTTGGAALFVTVTSTAQGRFADNVLLLLPHMPLTVNFLPLVAGERPTPANTRIDHVAMYTRGGTSAVIAK